MLRGSGARPRIRSAIFSAKAWFSISGLPSSCSARAMSFSASTPRLDCGTAAMPSRSFKARYEELRTREAASVPPPAAAHGTQDAHLNEAPLEIDRASSTDPTDPKTI